MTLVGAWPALLGVSALSLPMIEVVLPGLPQPCTGQWVLVVDVPVSFQDMSKHSLELLGINPDKNVEKGLVQQ